MYYVVRNDVGDVEQVYGYFSIKNIQDYCKEKYPSEFMRWELFVPKEYEGEIVYLPEEDV